MVVIWTNAEIKQLAIANPSCLLSARVLFLVRATWLLNVGIVNDKFQYTYAAASLLCWTIVTG